MQKLTPCLWFNDSAGEAVKFYTSIFKNSRIKAVTRYGEAGAAASGRPKALLEHNVRLNLVADRYPKGIEEH